VNPDFPIRVRMTCCGTTYADVRETIGHECPLPTALYDELIESAWRVRSAKGRIELRGCGVSLYRLDQMHRSLEAEQRKQDELLAELFAMGDDAARGFGPYRAAKLAALEATE
jgi:hypothetical protein